MRSRSNRVACSDDGTMVVNAWSPCFSASVAENYSSRNIDLAVFDTTEAFDSVLTPHIEMNKCHINC